MMFVPISLTASSMHILVSSGTSSSDHARSSVLLDVGQRVGTGQGLHVCSVIESAVRGIVGTQDAVKVAQFQHGANLLCGGSDS